MNVLHAPKNVGSHPSSLARAENAVRAAAGLPGRSWSVNFSPRPNVDPADEDYPLRTMASRGLLGRVAYATAPLAYGLRGARRFDVLHLNFGESLFSFSRRFSSLEMLDLPLWKALGKRVFMTFQGCDVRQKGLSARAAVSACRAGECDYAECDAALDRKRGGMVERVRAHADKVFCLNPDLVAFVPGAEFLPYASVHPGLVAPRPTDRPPSGPPTIVHAPTSRSIKGTRHVEAASKALQSALPHRLVMIENIDRAEVGALLQEADLVVDQLLVGWYGGLAVEAMARGVPVVAYIDPAQRAVVPPGMGEELPIVSATPDSLVDVLAVHLSDREGLRARGDRGLEYVRRWHDPLAIAARMLALYAEPGQSFWAGFPASSPPGPTTNP